MPWNELPVDVFESADSRDTEWSFESGEKAQTRKAVVVGYTTPEEAAQAAVDTPDTTTPLVIPYDPDAGTPSMIVRRVQAKAIQPDAYELTFDYRSLTYDDDPLSFTFSGQTEGGTQLVTQGYDYRSYGTGPNYDGAINVGRDGPEGVEIGIPGLEFTIHKQMAKGVLTLAYVASLTRLTYTTNNADFNGFAAGELLFKGAEFSQRSGAECSITFKFSASPNQNNLTIGSITGIEKKGHEYLWIDYVAVESSGFIIRQPRTVHVHRVYQESDFSLLGIDG
jgi:hypothetical protein